MSEIGSEGLTERAARAAFIEAKIAYQAPTIGRSDEETQAIWHAITNAVLGVVWPEIYAAIRRARGEGKLEHAPGSAMRDAWMDGLDVLEAEIRKLSGNT